LGARPLPQTSALDLLRRVGEADPLLPGAQHRDTPRACPTANAVRTFWPKYSVLERHRVRRVLIEQGTQRLVQLAEPRSRPVCRLRSAIDAAIERDEPAAPARDDAVAGVREPRVDSKHDHLVLRERAPDSPRPTGRLRRSPRSPPGSMTRRARSA
jgi:hypothetical protein